MNTKPSTIIAGVLLVTFLVALLGGCSLISQIGQATEMENGLRAQYQACATTVDTAYNQIAATINLSNNFYDQMKEIFVALASGETNGANFLAVMQSNAVASGTDWAAVSLEAIRVTNAGLENISVCQKTIGDKQAILSNLLGRVIGAAPGQAGTFPNAWFASINGLPHHLQPGAADSPKKDRDGDGYLTVFDYPAVVVTGLTRDAYEDGELPPVPGVATATPQP